MPARLCAWCRGPIPAGARRDSIVCSVRCRQARHRFTTTVGRGHASLVDEPLRLAYADPPYPGMSRRYYSDHPDYAGEVDHAELIRRLCSEFDGWALSTSARALPSVLALCPPDVRVGAWIRGERPTRSAGPLNAWEPVIFAGGRLDTDPSRRAGLVQPVSEDLDDASRLATTPNESRRRSSDDASRDTAADPDASRLTRAWDDASRPDPATRPDVDDDASRQYSGTRRDSIDTDASWGSPRRIDALVHVSRPRTTDPHRVIGAKPAAFCRWMFDLLGAQPIDELVDLYPGSGAVSRAWQVFAGH